MKTDEEKPLIAMSPRALVARGVLQPEVEYPVVPPLPSNEKWNYSKFKKVVQYVMRGKNVLAHTVRVRHVNGAQVEVWLQKGEKKIPLGRGTSFANAIENIFLAPLKLKEEAEQAELPITAPEECSDIPAEAPAR